MSKVRKRVLNDPRLLGIEFYLWEYYKRIHRRDNPPPPLERRLKWWHVYQLIDPRDDSVFYIGKGRPARLQEHEKEARLGLLTAKCIRIRDIWMDNLSVGFRTVALFTVEHSAYKHETKLIREFGSSITNRHPPQLWKASHERP